MTPVSDAPDGGAAARRPQITRGPADRPMSKATPPSEPSVLIVGAGPAGLTAAVVLAAHGVRTRVVDPESGPTDQSRALVVQARTLELWDKLGLAEPAIAAGKAVTGAIAHSGGKPINGGRRLLNFAALGTGQTPYPYLLVFEQSKTERLLLTKLHELGGTVDWGVAAHRLVAQDNCVEVTLRHRDRDAPEEVIREQWVIGADGARSVVRHALGLGFEGGSYEQAFFLADVAVTWAQSPDDLHLALTDTGTFLFVPMPTDATQPPRYRILGSLTPQMAAKATLDVADVQIALDQHSGIRATVSDARWVSIYRLHHRMAERFRVGNVFLAGDAAHVHSPVGGQGMNTGIQDAYNLAWKLALVIRRQASPTLLDSYASERMPVARALLNGTDKAFNVLVSDRITVRLGRKLGLRLLPLALNRATTTTRRLFATVSQIAISYALTGTTQQKQDVGGPQPGDRAPHAEFLTGPHAGASIFAVLTGPGYHLLVLDRSDSPTDALAAINDALAQALTAVHIHPIAPNETLIRDAYGITNPAMVLIRPDGYIAWRGATTDIHALATYLSLPDEPRSSSHRPDEGC